MIKEHARTTNKERALRKWIKAIAIGVALTFAVPAIAQDDPGDAPKKGKKVKKAPKKAVKKAPKKAPKKKADEEGGE